MTPGEYSGLESQTEEILIHIGPLTKKDIIVTDSLEIVSPYRLEEIYTV